MCETVDSVVVVVVVEELADNLAEDTTDNNHVDDANEVTSNISIQEVLTRHR